jgi:hypothetical protein
MIVRIIGSFGGGMRSQTLLGLGVVALLLAGCAGAHYKVSADRLKYPASLSIALPDGQGKPLYLDKDLQRVGEFSFTRTSVGFIYSATGTAIDLSDDLNREVQRRQGEGIVGLSLRSDACGSSWFFPLTVLPFYPGCQNLTVTGTVVTRRPAAGDPARSKP